MSAFTRVTILASGLIPLLLLLLAPVSVHAGVFSSFVSLFTESSAPQEETAQVDYSARYTPLLSSTINANPQNAIGGGDVSVENGALVSTGPVGADEIAASSNSGGEISVYIVREGDALSQIAEMYGVTTNTILWANDITNASGIQPGDTLVILPIVGVQHTVVSGETLGSILKKYDADKKDVLEYNNLTSADDLSIGDELMIPGGAVQISKKIAYAAPTKSSGVSNSTSLSHPAPGSVKTQGIHGYNAVDLAGAFGSPIRAAASGEVIVAKSSGWNGGYGQYVVIRHNNGTQTLYSHMSSVNVSVGQWVSQSEVIAGMGSTGKSTGTHVHFEVRGGRNPF